MARSALGTIPGLVPRRHTTTAVTWTTTGGRR